MNKKYFFLAIIMAAFFLITGAASAAPSFFEGNTIRIVVGYSAGGGFDAYARLIARHMGKNIPGKPTIIVENMTGAGGLISANYMYKGAKPDGLTIGHFYGGLFFNQVLQTPGIEYDARKFNVIGAPVKEQYGFAFTKKSGITSMEKLMNSKRPVKMGGETPGSFSIDAPIRIIKAAFGLPIQLVSGYKGSADIRLAVENGELDGAAWGWETMRVMWHKQLESGDVVVILQGVPEPFPDIPKVPLAISYAKTAEARQLIEVGIHSPSLFARSFVLPPETPKERVQILAKAFSDTLKDKEFLAEAEKAKLDIGPVGASDLEKAINAIFKLDNAMVLKLKDIFLK